MSQGQSCMSSRPPLERSGSPSTPIARRLATNDASVTTPCRSTATFFVHHNHTGENVKILILFHIFLGGGGVVKTDTREQRPATPKQRVGRDLCAGLVLRACLRMLIEVWRRPRYCSTLSYCCGASPVTSPTQLTRRLDRSRRAQRGVTCMHPTGAAEGTSEPGRTAEPGCTAVAGSRCYFGNRNIQRGFGPAAPPIVVDGMLCMPQQRGVFFDGSHCTEW